MVDAAGGELHKNVIESEFRERWRSIMDESDLSLVANGNERWWDYASWGATAAVTAGALIRPGDGNWSITDLGRQLLREIDDNTEMYRAIKRRARQARQERRRKAAEAGQRAWLVRGSSVLGVNLVPEWLEGGWCSLAASQLPVISPTIGSDELAALAGQAYGHLKHQEKTTKVDEIVDFVTRMKPADLVLTSSDRGVFVGELDGDWEYVSSPEGRANLRRAVNWRNVDNGIDFGDLPATLQAKLRTGATVADLTGELANIDELTTPALEDDEDDGEPTVASGPAPHERFDPLSQSVARSLLVGNEWLADFVQLLNDSRQVVLYGPPGTGKTYLARRIAEHLVGTERVRLVQFHPSYTYEDFFEGYRPSGDGRSGTVSLELRPGPLRALATEAREHPERAFVMIIDELNRANIAKVFGELYFLLEYRDDAVNVMYGDEPFTLPKNLYFICTMNTADRSIALLDAAMRRRFTFLELHPATEPTKSMLPEWLRQRELPSAAADLMTRVNELIDDHDAHIGPSYFMHPDQSEARLRRVFRTQIEPLLRETFYDRWSTLGSRFDFDRLWASVAANGAPAEGDGQGSPAEDEVGDALHEQGDMSPLPPPAVVENPPTT